MDSGFGHRWCCVIFGSEYKIATWALVWGSPQCRLGHVFDIPSRVTIAAGEDFLVQSLGVVIASLSYGLLLFSVLYKWVLPYKHILRPGFRRGSECNVHGSSFI